MELLLLSSMYEIRRRQPGSSRSAPFRSTALVKFQADTLTTRTIVCGACPFAVFFTCLTWQHGMHAHMPIWRHVCQRLSSRPGHSRTLVAVSYDKGDSNVIHKSGPSTYPFYPISLVAVSYAKGDSNLIHKSGPSTYPFCPISAHYSCCCRFALCSFAVCVCSALYAAVCLHSARTCAWQNSGGCLLCQGRQQPNC